MIHVTAHAAQRFRERVANTTDDAIRAALDTPAVRLAAKLGAPFVRLPGGQRVVLGDDGAVVTVLPKGYSQGAMSMHRTRGE